MSKVVVSKNSFTGYFPGNKASVKYYLGALYNVVQPVNLKEAEEELASLEKRAPKGGRVYKVSVAIEEADR